MSSKLAIISTIALTCAAVVQGASIVNGGNSTLVARACQQHDATRAICETSGGSPLVSDCDKAIKQLATRCEQGNDKKSRCKTQVEVGTCKIDVCGQVNTQIADGVNCGGYLQTILNQCQHDGRVGGYIRPLDCNVNWPDYPVDHTYRLQFSHSS